jgi:hypothetical protein
VRVQSAVKPDPLVAPNQLKVPPPVAKKPATPLKH